MFLDNWGFLFSNLHNHCTNFSEKPFARIDPYKLIQINLRARTDREISKWEHIFLFVKPSTELHQFPVSLSFFYSARKLMVPNTGLWSN